MSIVSIEDCISDLNNMRIQPRAKKTVNKVKKIQMTPRGNQKGK